MTASLGAYQKRLQDFLARGAFEPMTLGTAQFWINPESIVYRTEQIITVAPTLGGAVLQDWAATVPIWTLDGMTGTGGVKALRSIDAMRPSPSRGRVTYPFKFPSRFSGTRYVKVHVFEDSYKPEAHLYNFYHIEMYEVQRVQPANYTRADASVGPMILLPATG